MTSFFQFTITSKIFPIISHIEKYIHNISMIRLIIQLIDRILYQLFKKNFDRMLLLAIDRWIAIEFDPSFCHLSSIDNSRLPIEPCVSPQNSLFPTYREIISQVRCGECGGEKSAFLEFIPRRMSRPRVSFCAQG